MTCRAHGVRNASRLLVGLLLCVPAVLSVEITFDIRTADNQSAVTITAGGTLPLYISLATSPETAVGSLFYTVECPDASWSIATRDYASYGWLQNDGVFDNSTPMPGGSSFPVAVTSDLFVGANPTTADFSFDTVRNPSYGETITGGVVEAFSLVVPTAPGDYVLRFGELSAYGGSGDWLGGEIGHEFTVTVLVPEPAGLLLLGLAAAAGTCLWRGRRSRG